MALQLRVPLESNAKEHENSSGEESAAWEDGLKGIDQIFSLPLTRFSNGEQGTIDFFSSFGSEASGHLLPVLALSQIPFTHVVVEGDVEIVQEQEMIPLVFF